jgi:glutaredoxin 3
MNKWLIPILMATTPIITPINAGSRSVKQRLAEHELIFYYRSTCFWCNRVIDVLKALKVPVIYKDISLDKAAKRELIQIGGKQQVPCLFVDGHPIYESKDIIQWLKDHYTAKMLGSF